MHTRISPDFFGMTTIPAHYTFIQMLKIHTCVDLKRLNESVLQEVYPLPIGDDILAQLAGAKCFSKLDANSGFWQIPLTEKSRLVTTYLTPFGRYCFTKLPFGISSGPELFQKRMSQILSGLDGVACLIDDILVMGKEAKEHDERLLVALQRIQDARVTLNREKCVLHQSSVKLLGHIVDQEGIHADPEKTEAI